MVVKCTHSVLFFCVYFVVFHHIKVLALELSDNATRREADSNAVLIGFFRTNGVKSPQNETRKIKTFDEFGNFSHQAENGFFRDNGIIRSDTGLSTQFQLPTNWKSMCDIGTDIYQSNFTPETELLEIKCTVHLKYSNIINVRDLTVISNTTAGVKLSIDIQCFDHATVSISWPIKIRNLYKISVKDCRIRDYYSDYNSKVLDDIPDSLRVLDYRNVIIMFPLSRFTEMITKVDEFSKEYNCGHEETIELLSMVNQTEDFIMDLTEIPDILLVSEEYMRDFRRISHTCDFKHLMEIDESLSDSQSTYKMQTLIQHSIFDQLRVFNQSHSFIKSIKEPILHWSVHFPNLEMFDLSWNNISGLYRFEVPVQASPDKVTTINLQHNNITMITVKQLGRLTLMPSMFLDIRNNPIDCTCSYEIELLLEYIHAKRYRNISKIVNYSYLEELQCATPTHLKGKQLGELQVTDACPVETSTEYFVVPILILVVSIVILTVMLVLVFRYRQDIQIILFTRFDIIVPCQSRVAARDKQYDAFVSYSSNDEDWIEEFFENLEKKPSSRESSQFKFCMHHRDFIPGKTIFDNVINSVEASRHTIILLSKHYLGSEFCLYEFQEAFRQSVMERKRHLIIVMMEDIPEADLPRDLKRCIKTFTYIRKDDRLFAQRLMFALMIKQKSKQVLLDKDFNSDLTTPSLNQQSKQISKPSSTFNTDKIRSLVSPKRQKTSQASKSSKCNKNMVQLEDIVKTASNNMPENGKTKSVVEKEATESKLKNLEKNTCFSIVTGSQNQGTTLDKNNAVNIFPNCLHTSDSKSELNEFSKQLQVEKMVQQNAQTRDKMKCYSLPISEPPDVASRVPFKLINPSDRLDSSNSLVYCRHVDSRVEYDRSISCLSQDTGYGSDRGSYNERSFHGICDTP